MDARTSCAVAIAAALLSMGASWRTQNFVVTASTPQFARQVAEQAEVFRRELAREWLGDPLPPWHQPCPIRVQDSPRLGAGGATSFMFDDHGRPFGWKMSIQGSQQAILDSVLPHEVTRTIFATHFGRPLPRWADEGACTTVESARERRKQDHMLVDFLTSERGIPFNTMFRLTEYPADIMPLYSQGYSVAQFLIAQGGKRKFIRYVGRGMETGNWDAATNEYYGFKDLSDLQVTWVDWLSKGRPAVDARVAVAQNQPQVQPPAQPDAMQVSTVQENAPSAPAVQLADHVAPPATPTALATTRDANPRAADIASREQHAAYPTDSAGWYAKQARLAALARQSGAPRTQASSPNSRTADIGPSRSTGAPPSSSREQAVTRPQPYQQAVQTILEPTSMMR